MKPLSKFLKKAALELVAVFVLLLLSCPVKGQVQHKKHLTRQDYGKWGTLWMKEFSQDGEWISFEMAYESHNDTLFLKNLQTLKEYHFAGGFDGRFMKEGLFACLIPNSRLQVLDLITGDTRTFKDVDRYEFIANQKNMVTYGKGILTILDENYHRVDIIEGVTTYVLNPKKDMLIYACGTEVGIIRFDNYDRYVLPGENRNAGLLAWQDSGKSVAYVDRGMDEKSETLKLYSITSRKLSTIDISKGQAKVFRGAPLKISDDGERVFAMVVSTVNAVETTNSVEVWNGNDDCLLPERQRLAGYGNMPNLGCWNIANTSFNLVGTDELPNVMLSPEENYAIVSDRYSYGRKPTYFESVDYHLVEIETGHKRMLLKEQSRDPSLIGFGVFQDIILYYKESDWWLYDIKTNSHRNITNGIAERWDNMGDHVPNQFGAYGNAGWSADGKYVLLYDEFDIWVISVDGKEHRRLTHGRERNIIFRIAQEEMDGSDVNYDGRTAATFDLKKGFLLEMVNRGDWKTGFSFYNSKVGVSEIVYGAKSYRHIRKFSKGYVFTSETFAQPATIEFKNSAVVLPNVIFESNTKLKSYHYGSAALLKYNNRQGHCLNAALFYPAGYDKSKKYPMVVWIYDDVSKNLNNFVNPSMLNGEGFNVSNLTLEGYFVLMPDIMYRKADPGVAASECVIAAVRSVLGKGIVEKGKIGLMGHSFGGYETNFILTQTDLFTAAVSGAGITDNVGFYFNISRNGFAVPDMWRFESQQWRIGRSLYEDMEAYLRNSPILFADKVTTPLLLWSGKDDRSVPMNQSVTYYLALRRLGKECIFLAYPNEDHSLSNPDNERDLTIRISEWFDYFLKGVPGEWIEKGIKERK